VTNLDQRAREAVEEWRQAITSPRIAALPLPHRKTAERIVAKAMRAEVVRALEETCEEVVQTVYDELAEDCGATLAKAGAHAAKTVFRYRLREYRESAQGESDG